MGIHRQNTQMSKLSQLAYIGSGWRWKSLPLLFTKSVLVLQLRICLWFSSEFWGYKMPLLRSLYMQGTHHVEWLYSLQTLRKSNGNNDIKFLVFSKQCLLYLAFVWSWWSTESLCQTYGSLTYLWFFTNRVRLKAIGYVASGFDVRFGVWRFATQASFVDVYRTACTVDVLVVIGFIVAISVICRSQIHCLLNEILFLMRTKGFFECITTS